MAGASGAPTGTARYSTAWKAGNAGRAMPSGLADLADTDPKIDAAYDAGSNNVPFSEWASSNGVGSSEATGARGTRGAAPRGPSGSGGSVGSSRRGGSTRRSSTRSPRPRRPLPAPTIADPLRPVSGGPVQVGKVGASVFLGALFYALVLSVVDYGPTGPKLWFDAKFLNKATPKPAKAG